MRQPIPHNMTLHEIWQEEMGNTPFFCPHHVLSHIVRAENHVTSTAFI